MKNYFTIIFLILFQIGFAQSKIEQSKEEVKSDKNNSNPPNESYGDQQGNSDYKAREDEEKDKTFAEVVFKLMTYATYYTAIGSYQNEDHLYNDLSPYPYFDGKRGNYVGYDSISQVTDRFRMEAEVNGLYSNKNFFGTHATLKIRPFQYFYLQTDYHELMEKWQNDTEHLSLFHFNINYDRLRLEKFDLGWTVGATYIGNEVHRWGYNFGLQSNYFVGKNFSLTGALKWGWINQTPVNTSKFSLQYHLKKQYITAGYEHLKIGTPHYNYLQLGVGYYF